MTLEWTCILGRRKRTELHIFESVGNTGCMVVGYWQAFQRKG